MDMLTGGTLVSNAAYEDLLMNKMTTCHVAIAGRSASSDVVTFIFVLSARSRQPGLRRTVWAIQFPRC